MKYYLLYHEATNRMLIDRHTRRGWVKEKETVAKSWIEAKKNFGFELTPLQEMIHAKDDCVETRRRIVRHQQDARSELRPADGELSDGVEALEDTWECV